MPNTAWPSIRALAARVTKVDECGVPVAEKSVVVTGGTISNKFKPNYEKGEDTSQKNGAGQLCVVDKQPDQLKNVDIEIDFCGVDPDLFGITTGQPVTVDNEGNSTGFGLRTFALPGWWALELWSDIPGAACTAGKPHGYFLLPLIGSAQVSDWTLEEKLAKFTLSGTTLLGNTWGKGPYNVVLNGTGQTAAAGQLLTELPSDQQFYSDRTLVPVPALTEGAVDLAEAPGYHTPTP